MAAAQGSGLAANLARERAGPSEKKGRVLLQAKEKRQLREQEMAKAQMAAALDRGISWGMGEDAGSDQEEGGPPTVEWRAYAQTQTLTDHQQKLAEKLRRLENRIRNLTTEADRIRVRYSSLPRTQSPLKKCRHSCVAC